MNHNLLYTKIIHFFYNFNLFIIHSTFIMLFLNVESKLYKKNQ